MRRWLACSLAAALWCGAAHGQTGQFNPGANPISNQAWNFNAVTVGAVHSPTRAIYNGNGSSCAITVQPNGAAAGSTVTFANVQPGEILPIQELAVTATTCSNVVELY